MKKILLTIGILLTLFVTPLHAAVEFMPLKEIRISGYPVHTSSSDNGDIYIVDSINRKLLVYNDNYKLVSRITTLSRPSALASLGDNIIIFESTSRTVNIIDKLGNILGSLKRNGDIAKFRLVQGIVTGEDGTIYVMDTFGNAIKIFDSAWNFVEEISISSPKGGVIIGDELFILHNYVGAVGTESGGGDGYPSTRHTGKVLIYNLVTRTFVEDPLRVFPGPGRNTAVGQHIHLAGIAKDPSNNIYLIDSYVSVLYKHDINGQFLGEVEYPIENPLGVNITYDGRLVVVQDKAAKILGIDFIAGQDTWLNPTPDAPIINTGNPESFSWSDVSGAETYDLEYSFSSTFDGSVVLSGLTSNDVAVALEDFDRVNSYGTWYWRVRAVNSAGKTSDWSSVGTFNIEPDCIAIVPDIPSLLMPLDGAIDVPKSFFLETYDIVYPTVCGEHKRTEWQISLYEDFSELIMHTGSMNYLTLYEVPDLMLEADTTYFWRVKQVSDLETKSEWSEAYMFTTEAAYTVVGENGIIYFDDTIDPPIDDGSMIRIKTDIVGDYTDLKGIRTEAYTGIRVRTIKRVDPESIIDYDNRPDSFPLGMLRFKLEVDPGAYASVEFVYSDVVTLMYWSVYDFETGWYSYDDISLFDDNQKTLLITVQDGGLGDADGVENSIIISP